jgi:FixJ family two-component response regulator
MNNSLTLQEREVCALLAQGDSIETIASKLGLGKDMIKVHKYQINNVFKRYLFPNVSRRYTRFKPIDYRKALKVL